jgi:hypothetical protein
MAFMVYGKQGDKLIQTGEYFSLAGYNLIYKLWEKRGKPTDQGWHMTADDLIKEYTEGKGNSESHSLLIDFHPNSRNRIGIIELLDIYAYTWSGETKKDAGWTPMMLRLRDILYEEYEKEISDADKELTMKALKNPNDKKDFIEFLYLNGPDKGWNWGRNGMTNAAFINGPAREYFRQYF